jgi:8-oxo-dGTP pyrophosphatase MutT (NUDIX family)
MIKAAGIMFLTEAGEVLFLKRGNGGDHPLEWCFPGGTTEGTETAEETATRETIEEIGFLPDGARGLLTRSTGTVPTPEPVTPDTGVAAVPAEPVEYTTFLQRVKERFDPRVNGEHTGFAWAKMDAPPEPLHPGCRIALARLGMNELDIARAMAAGELTSPQRYHNVWLFDIRITGTGYAFRNRGRMEHVWRDQKYYLNEDFIARCNGLTVVWTHPEASMLNSEEYADKSIGAVMLPYIKGDSVWGIAKIYDDEAAEDMALQDLSTSPGVILGGVDDIRVKMKDGLVLLIEGDPVLVDHIALCPNGVWDKGGDPSGVRTDSVRNSTMPQETEEEKKAREEREAKDAARDAKLDRVMDAVTKMADAFGGRLDSIDARDAKRDAEEKERRDAVMEQERKAEEAMTKARADARARRDAERETWMKEDAALCADEDAREALECDAYKKDGMDDDEAMDRARKDRRDRMDKRRKDAAAEEEKKIADAARKDAATHLDAAAVAKIVAETLAKQDRTEADTTTLGLEQARADAIYTAFGSGSARRPMSGETPGDYQVAMAREFQKYSPRWKGTNLALVDAATRGVIIADIYNDAIAASKRTDDLEPGQLIYTTRSGEGGHQITEARGRNTFIHGLKRDSMRVTKFMTERRAS